MDLEYLVLSIAKGVEEDFNKFYNETKNGAFAFALALTGDRQVARDAAAESYRRVSSEAKVFDTGMSAKMWHLEILRNLCMNGLADGEIAMQAAQKRRENLSILLTNGLFETAEDRGIIIAARLGAGLSRRDAAKLLWYNTASCSGEYTRGIREAADLSGYKGEDSKPASEIETMLREDFESATPDFLELAKGGRETMFCNINSAVLLAGESEGALPGESREDRQKRIAEKTLASKRRKVITIVIILAAVAVAAAVGLTIFFSGMQRSLIEEPDATPVPEPQYRTVADVTVYGDNIYYSNYADDGCLYVYDLKTEKSNKISNAKPRDFSEFSGSICYFRDSSKGEIAKLDAKTNTVEYTGITGAIPCIYGDDVYISTRNGVSVLSGGEVKEIFNDSTGTAFRCDMAVINGVVVFSSAPSAGLYRMTPTALDEYYVEESLPDYVINDFYVSGTYIVFDDGTGNLFVIDVESGKLLPRIGAEILSGGITTDGDTIYFYGKTSDGPKGVYSITIEDAAESKEPSLVLSLEDQKYDLSDIYVSGDVTVLYYSNGEKTGAYNELQVINRGESPVTVFKNTN